MKKFSVVLLLLMVTGCASTAHPATTYTVVLEQNEAFTCDQYVKHVERGQDVTFDIVINDGYRIDSLKNAEWNLQHQLLVKNVNCPTRVLVGYKLLELYNLDVQYDHSKGNIEGIVGNKVYEGTELTLKATPYEGYGFYGWLLDNQYLHNNNELKVTINEDTTIKGVFMDISNNTIIYHPNGGTLLNNEEYYVQHYLEFDDVIKRPNTIMGVDLFYREGYTLTSWNTEADGRGTAIGLGSRITPSESNILYAHWEKWDNKACFEYELDADEITITKFLPGQYNTGLIIVVPGEIDGHKVTKIAANTFRSNIINKIIFPNTIKRIEDKAANGTGSLQSITFFDNIEYISNNSFYQCSNLRNIHINAAQAPKYCDSDISALANKMDALLTSNVKNLVFIGGSNITFGVDVNYIMEHTDYQPIAIGINASQGERFYYQLVERHIKAGDIVVDMPIFRDSNIRYNNYFNPTNFECLESNYDLLKDINYGYFGNLLTAFNSFNNTRKPLDASDYNKYFKKYDKWGAINYYREDAQSDYIYTSDLVNCNPSLITDTSKWWVDLMNYRINEAGAKLYVTPCPFNQNAVIDVSLLPEFNTRAHEYISNLVGDYSDFMYPGNNFYNSNWHLSSRGATIYTKQILDLIPELD